jgi:hypothetical protein
MQASKSFKSALIVLPLPKQLSPFILSSTTFAIYCPLLLALNTLVSHCSVFKVQIPG